MHARQWSRLPDRRQSTRILTLKNAVWFLVGLLVVFIAFSTYNELRPGNASRERLYERGRDGAPSRKPVEVTGQHPVSDETFATPTSVEHDRQAQFPLTVVPSISTSEPTPGPTLKETQQRGGRIVITGGTEGLRVDVRPSNSTGPVITTTTAPPLPPDRF